MSKKDSQAQNPAHEYPEDYGYLLLCDAEPQPKIDKETATKDGATAHFISEGWFFEKKEDAERVAKLFSTGKRVCYVEYWVPEGIDPKKLFKGSEKEKKTEKRKIQQRFSVEKNAKALIDIQLNCIKSGLHASFLRTTHLPEEMGEKERKAHAYYKPLFDKAIKESEELKIKGDDIDRQQEDSEKPSGKVPIFKPLIFEELLKRPKKEWILDKIFGPKEIGMIFGQPGCGKTFVAIDLIMCVCKGLQFANRFPVKRELNVAYCAGEGVGGLPSRFASAAKHYGIKSLPNFTFFENTPQLYEIKPGTEDINSFVREWSARQLKGEAEPLDLLVIDTLHSSSVASDENSARDMGRVLGSCRFAVKELGCTVLLIHHSNKGGTAERGSSSLRGGMDFVLEIKKSSGGTEMICSKLKDGEQWENQAFKLEPVIDCESARISWDEPGSPPPLTNLAEEETKSRLLEEMRKVGDQRLTCNSLSEAVGKKPEYIRTLLVELVSEGRCLKSLSNPESEKSSKNPWVYYVSQT